MDKPRILIIDDDPVVRDVLSQIVDSLGFCSDVAVDGIEGLKKLNNTKYDLIFTDLNMPKMDGLEFLREVKSISPLTPVAIITGYPTLEDAVDAIREGAKDFITKPFKSEQIKTTIERLLRERMLLRGISSGGNTVAVNELYKEVVKRLEEIAILQSVSTELDELYDNNEIYDRIVFMASRLLTANEVCFGILSNGYLRIKSATGRTKKEIPVAGSVLEKVIKEKEYHIIPSGETNPFTDAELTTELLLIPLITNNEVFGLLSITNKIEAVNFTEDEIYLAITFGKKVSLRIENNTLYEIFYTTLINTLKSLVVSIEARDSYTMHHSERVTNYALQICDVMKLSKEEKEIIQFGGYLHDIGKIGVKDTVLLKPSRLTEEEMDEIKRHPIIGESIIRPLRMFTSEKDLILMHHERIDGNGYPLGLTGDKIPLLVKILTVADTYDAMTSTRPYRAALSHTAAIKELQRCSGTQFDPEVVKAFLQTPVGRGGYYEIQEK